MNVNALRRERALYPRDSKEAAWREKGKHRRVRVGRWQEATAACGSVYEISGLSSEMGSAVGLAPSASVLKRAQGSRAEAERQGSDPGEEEVKEVIQVKGRKRDKRGGPAAIPVKDGVPQKGGGGAGLALF